MSANPKTYGPLIESHCPACNYKLTGATVAHGDDNAPKAGDMSVCLNCGQVLTYQDDLSLRKSNAAEIRELMTAAPEAWATIEKAQLFISRRGRFA